MFTPELCRIRKVKNNLNTYNWKIVKQIIFPLNRKLQGCSKDVYECNTASQDSIDLCMHCDGNCIKKKKRPDTGIEEKIERKRAVGTIT